MDEKLTRAKYIEFQSSLFGAFFIAFGIGAWLSNYVALYIPWIIIVGIGLHSWGMYKIHERNK